MSSTLPKVCIVSISLANGGAERSAAVLSSLLTNLGYEVHMAILNNQIDYPYQGKLYNLGEEKEDVNHPIARFKRFNRFKHYLKDQDIDVIIDHRPKNNYYREVFYAKYLYRDIPSIYVVHSSKKETYFGNPIRKMVKLYQHNFCNVGVSKHITKKLLLDQDIENAIHIPNAYLTSWRNKKKILPIDLKGKSDFILFYGRIDDEIKDIKFLINSFTASKVWEKGIQLVIMGDGPDKSSLLAHSYRLPSADFIQFIPYQSNPFQVIEQSRLVAMTSKYEGFPMIFIESLSLETPIVSLDFVSGPAEVIQDRINGLLVKERSETAFASALKEMCFDDELYEVCKANTVDSIRAYAETEIASKWDKLLRSLPK